MFRVLQYPHLIHTTPRVAKNKSNWKTTSGHCSGKRIVPDMAIYLFIYNSYNPLTDRESPPRKFCGMGIGNGFSFTDFSCSLHTLPMMYQSCWFCDLSWPLHRLPITYNVCLDDNLSCFSSHTFNDLPCLPRLWFILCFSPRISNNLWCLRRVWFIPYFTKKSYCLACLTRLWFIWIVPWFFFSLLMFIFDNEWYFAGLVLP